MQTCPALLNPVAATAVATFSRSASGITISGALLPSSIVTFFRPATRQICSPTSRLPVKVILRTRGSRQSASPISPPLPVMHCTASGGAPASSMILVSLSALSGVSVAGFTMTLLPAARAGPTLWQTRWRGKLNGLIARTTPHGTRTVNPNFLVTPGARSMACASALGMVSTWEPSYGLSTGMVLGLSIHSVPTYIFIRIPPPCLSFYRVLPRHAELQLPAQQGAAGPRVITVGGLHD